MVSAVLMWKLPRSNRKGLLAANYVFYTYWGPYVLSTSLPMGNTSGHSKKVAMNAVFFIAYCIGNIIGPQVFRVTNAPDYSHGYIGLVACLIVAMIAISWYGLLCYHENKRRDRQCEATIDENSTEGAFSDRTDVQKKGFRYIY
jgi:ACS family allantoate permease-like MFS transporter